MKQLVRFLFLFSAIVVAIIGVAMAVSHEMADPVCSFLSTTLGRPFDDTQIRIRHVALQVAISASAIAVFVALFPRLQSVLVREEPLGPNKRIVELIFHVISALIVFLLVSISLVALYRPGIEQVHKEIAALFGGVYANNNELTQYFRPEPHEFLIYLCGILVAPLSLAVSKHIFGRHEKKIYEVLLAGQNFSRTFMITSFAFSLLLFNGLFALNYHSYETNLLFYFRDSFVFNHLISYTFVAFPIIAYCFFRSGGMAARWSIPGSRITDFFVNAILMAVLAAIFFANLFSTSFKPGNLYNTVPWHFDALFYSIVQIVRDVPLFVNSFSNTYGFYALFLAPVFKLIGLDVFKFSLLMSFLNVVSFVLFFLFLREAVADKRIAVLSFLTLTSIYMYQRGYNDDPYLQYYPLRTIFPFLFLFLSARYYERRSKIVYSISAIIYPVAGLWNPDSGLILIIAWLGFLFFISNFSCETKQQWAVMCLRHLAVSLSGLAVAVACVLIYYKFAYERTPSLRLLFVPAIISRKYGYYNLKMAMFHPWNMVVLAYVIGIALGVIAIFERKLNKTKALSFLCSILGLGLFSYMVGRSNNWCLINIAWPFIAVIAIYIDRIREKLARSKRGLIGYQIAFCVMLYFLGGLSLTPLGDPRKAAVVASDGVYFILERLGIRGKYFFSKEQNEYWTSLGYWQECFDKNIRFIRSHSTEGESVLILTHAGMQGLYFCASGTRAAFNPGFIDLFWDADYKRLVDEVHTGRHKIFLHKGGFWPKLNLARVLGRTYRVLDENNDWQYLKSTALIQTKPPLR